MTDGGIQSMKNSVALMMKHGAEVARIKALVPPNTDTGCEAK